MIYFCSNVFAGFAGPDDPAHIKFEAESPDESALVVAAKVMGFFCYKRTNTAVYVRESVDGQQVDLEFEILNILEFDSTRKRMSTIVRSPEGKIMLFCKVCIRPSRQSVIQGSSVAHASDKCGNAGR